MCGINGIIFSKKNYDIERQINEMNDAIIHRGPDGDGTYIYQDRLAMGMRRLAIIDLTTGNQPIFNEDRTLAIVFNGEIYNFLLLKEQLKAKGVVFRTNSDTEVLLKMYEIYGVEAFRQLNGMFVFSIHDVKSNKLLIVRDRFGEKPLFYYKNDESIYWASELKSIKIVAPNVKKTISTKALSLYFSLSYIPSPYSIYQNVSKLRAGHYLSIDTNDCCISENIYWDITKPNIFINDYNDAKQELKALLFDSVEKRMIADVPVGVFLSGGVDSTIIAAIMAKLSPNKKIKTFSIGFDYGAYDETSKARHVAEYIGSEHHEFRLNGETVLKQIDNVVLNFDEPFADSSSLPTYFVSYETSKHVKVALTGDGGDEVFGGYNKYLLSSYGATYSKLIPDFFNTNVIKPLAQKYFNKAKNTKSKGYKLNRFIQATGKDWVKRHLDIMSLSFNDDDKTVLLINDYYQSLESILNSHIMSAKEVSNDILKVVRYLDKNISLEGDMLVKVDRTSMLNSIECRAPYLDHRLMEFSYSIPDSFLIKRQNKKRILKDTFADMLPKGFFSFSKSGFEMPIGDWFRAELKQDLLFTLTEDNLDKHRLFNKKLIQELINQHLYQGIDHSRKIWSLYCFQKWYNNE